MTYNGFVETLSERVNGLPPQRRAAVFWLTGTALRSKLNDLESSGWTSWFDEASELGVDYVVDGRVGERVTAAWERALEPVGQDEQQGGQDGTQLLNSAIVCLSSPLAIAIDPRENAGPWIVYALFPVINAVSLDLYDDIAFPEDDELEEVFASSQFQAAGAYCSLILGRLENDFRLDRVVLNDLLIGAEVLNGVSE